LVVPAPWRFIEQYFLPAITVPFQVKQPSVRVKVAPEPLQLVGVAETVPLGKVPYAPGSVTAPIAVTFPPEIVAVNMAGELVVV